MKPWFNTPWLRPLQTYRASTPATPDAQPALARCLSHADTDTPTAEAPSADVTAGCGWFESSLDLQQGLAVCEWPASDDAVAALWFSAAGGQGGASAALH